MPKQLSDKLKLIQLKNEQWEVCVDKKKFILNGLEVDILRKAINDGQRGMTWFKKIGISIPHISSVEKIGEKIDFEKQILMTVKISEEERIKNLQKIKEIKEKFNI
jgi:hypothetical protein